MCSLLCCLFAVVTCSTAQNLPPERAVDWHLAGLRQQFPAVDRWVDVTDFGAVGDGVTNDTHALRAALASLNGHSGGVYIPPGNYLLQHHVLLHDSVIIHGAGATQTTLLLNHDTAGLAAYGSVGTLVPVLEGHAKNSTWIRVQNPNIFQPNGWLEIQQTNGSWYVPEIQEEWADDAVGQLIRIGQIAGDTLWLHSPLRASYDSALAPAARPVFPVEHVGIECLKLQHIDSNYVSSFPNIDLRFCVESRIAGIESHYSCAPHIALTSCSNIEVTGSYIHHAWHYTGAGRRGYGVSIERHSGECVVENNIFHDLRHSMMAKVGVNGNVFGYNYSFAPHRAEPIAEFSGDFSLHGHWPYANLFEGNHVQNIILDHFWGPSGEHNTLFRNLVEMYGIVFTESDNTALQTDGQNVIGNVITRATADSGDAVLLSPFFTLFYGLLGADHFEYGNLVEGVVTPANTTALTETSFYFSGLPDFWPQGLAFPPFGLPNTTTQGQLPAQQRYQLGTELTICPEMEPATLVSEPSRENGVKLFPNPATDVLHLSMPVASIEAYDLLGRKLGEWQHVASIPLHNLPGGLCVFRVSNGDKTSTHNVFIR